MGDKPIVPVPPPWKLKGTVYMMSFWNKAGNLPEHAYSPLERESYSSPQNGKHVGGLSQIQLIRYTSSPVGPYDELIICPGFFAYEKEEEDGKRKTDKKARITRIYVSQKYTCWNGRKKIRSFDHKAKATPHPEARYRSQGLCSSCQRGFARIQDSHCSLCNLSCSIPVPLPRLLCGDPDRNNSGFNQI
ncbi:hypothetical protein F4780DRAFT_186413 [Xylariomycetidae sp. FL0641]|nr:hypothetical protein F4780DRAFT_186413 [Xylariomycetidae sp. FL0641]